MTAIERCRTSALGGHVEQCDHCGERRIAYNSCRSRSCPKCQWLARAEWIEARREELLDTQYFHVVFTVPDEIAAIAFQNASTVYKILAQGTGQALDTARRGDADVVFVHAKAQEEKFLAEGFGVKRFDVMYNDFVLIGPKSDPAGIKGKDIESALKTIQGKAAPFVSRGDRSGTHSAELALWKQAGIDIATAKGPWYREIGQGMGAALNTANAMNAYVLSDRGTWISFENRGELGILVEGDKRLFNQYGVMLVNPETHPSVKKELGQAFVDWLISAEGQAAIAGYQIGGQQLFFPDADKKGS
jgi:tungstate transport system substrate-binding protein